MSDTKTEVAKKVNSVLIDSWEVFTEQLTKRAETIVSDKAKAAEQVKSLVEKMQELAGGAKPNIQSSSIPNLFDNVLSSALVSKDTAVKGVDKFVAAAAKGSATIIEHSTLKVDEKTASLTKVNEVVTEGLAGEELKNAKESFTKMFKNLNGNILGRTTEALQMNPRTTLIGSVVAMVAGIFAFKSGMSKTDEQGQETEKGSFWKKALGALMVVGGIAASVTAVKGVMNNEGSFWQDLVKGNSRTFKGQLTR